eukprot:1590320-Rhodomonas_salina.1
MMPTGTDSQSEAGGAAAGSLRLSRGTGQWHSPALASLTALSPGRRDWSRLNTQAHWQASTSSS